MRLLCQFFSFRVSPRFNVFLVIGLSDVSTAPLLLFLSRVLRRPRRGRTRDPPSFSPPSRASSAVSSSSVYTSSYFCISCSFSSRHPTRPPPCETFCAVVGKLRDTSNVTLRGSVSPRKLREGRGKGRFHRERRVPFFSREYFGSKLEADGKEDEIKMCKHDKSGG